MSIKLYNIKLKVEPTKDTYLGTVTIIHNDDTLELNTEVEINKVIINDKEVKFDLNNKMLKINAKKQNVRIDFTGKIRNSLLGFYRSKDTLVTHFEPNDARKFFPCVDSPKVKAVYKMTVSVPSGHIVLFNTPVLKKETNGDFITYVFKYTPLMSTYLLAMSVGKYDAIEYTNNEYKHLTYEELCNEKVEDEEEDLESIINQSKESKQPEKNMEQKSANESKQCELPNEIDNFNDVLLNFSKKIEKKKTKLRIYTEIGLANQAKMALSLTHQFIDDLSKFFDYSFPLEKMDQLALKKFGMGAMENFGLITYRDSLLLFDKNSNPSYLAYIAETVAHELVHQWFGNLVTPSSWKDLWLNEGFATFLSNHLLSTKKYSYFLENEELPLEYDFMGDFVSHTEHGLFLDSLSSHSIITDSNANEIFDEISYQKSSAVIKMLFIDKLEKLKSYIKKYAYQSVSSDDILHHLSIDMIKEWLYEKHYPLLQVRVEGSQMHISQSVFTLLDNNDTTIWYIPFKIIYNGESKSFVLKEKEKVINLSEEFSYSPEKCKKIKNETDQSINPLQSTNQNESVFLIQNEFFRVYYSDLSVYKIINIHTVNDLYSLFLKGLINLSDYLKIIDSSEYLTYFTFESVTSQLFSLIKKINLDRKYLIRILHQTTPLNTVLDKKREALRLKYLLLLGENPFIPDDPFFKVSKYIQSVKNNNHSGVFDIYLNTKTPDERSAALFAIFSSTDLSVLKNYFDKFMNYEIDIGSSIYIFNGMSCNLSIREELIDLVLATDLNKLFNDDKTLLGDCLETIFTNVPDKYVERVQEYIKIDDIEKKRIIINDMIKVDKRIRERIIK